METTSWIILGLIAFVVTLFLLLKNAYERLARVHFEKRSLSTKYGKLSEQFMPFLEHYPYDPQLFRFLGTPIDGVQFGEEEIVFLEFKTAGGALSPAQRRVRELIEERKVRFETIKIK
jgi:predicted Holliday junction resolvase-like endonuclease